LFLNLRGERLTRVGVYQLLKRCIGLCTDSVASLRGRRIHPHMLRHTTAVHLPKAGVDFATISQWLGHSSLNTTMTYARADLDLKHQALLQVFPDAPRPPRGGKLGMYQMDVVDWLRRL
jgi:integrase/recombinase XerD